MAGRDRRDILRDLTMKGNIGNMGETIVISSELLSKCLDIFCLYSRYYNKERNRSHKTYFKRYGSSISGLLKSFASRAVKDNVEVLKTDLSGLLVLVKDYIVDLRYDDSVDVYFIREKYWIQEELETVLRQAQEDI